MELGTAPASPDEHVLRVGALAIHCLEWPGPTERTIVMLHGGGLTARTWDRVAPLLRDEARCLAPSLRGHGDSDWAPDGDYSLDALVADLVGLVSLLGLSRVVLVGMSLGGLIAMQYATQVPAELAALVLVDEGLSPDPSGQEHIRKLLRGPRDYRSLDDLVDRLVAFNPRRSRESLEVSVRHNLRREADGLWRWKYDPRAIDAMTAGSYGPSRERLRPRVGAIRCPTLVVRGAESREFLESAAQELTALLPDGRSVTIPGAGHSVQSDQPEALASAIREFVRDSGA